MNLAYRLERPLDGKLSSYTHKLQGCLSVKNGVPRLKSKSTPFLTLRQPSAGEVETSAKEKVSRLCGGSDLPDRLPAGKD
ncbi:MAG: hypothetical protein KBC07_04000 [Bacteroidales bacterium]|nr:hypothetical protein [Bacteroidales bacterium]NLH24508.1 hypothetical protein [Bacteroidales bacterium]